MKTKPETPKDGLTRGQPAGAQCVGALGPCDLASPSFGVLGVGAALTERYAA